ncbi:HYC_CC_PP family protein [Mucilaginibacter sp.]
MLKKSGALLLTMLYIITVVGFALNFQYCGKVITDVKINAPLQGCIKSPMAAKMRCCTQKHFDIKIKDAHETGPSSILAKVFAFQLPALLFSRFSFNARTAFLQKSFYEAPPEPGRYNVAVFVRNCNFRI